MPILGLLIGGLIIYKSKWLTGKALRAYWGAVDPENREDWEAFLDSEGL